ncbi:MULTISPECIES: hypothetical protein [unclassified Mameliella]|uniref:hypothetical protein n=1 Tax=unclassified Mameliella TaxID=2630630 RepID=UPI0027400A10|nr:MULTISPECIES: hypothetical protein [unclassified Mameliella]
MSNLSIDSKQHGYGLGKMKTVDVMASGQIKAGASVLQRKIRKPVAFKISKRVQTMLKRWMRESLMIGTETL